MKTTQALLDSARAHMTPTYSPPPFVAVRGMGTRLWDNDGKEYVDFAQGIGVNIIGHAHPAVVEAITRQASNLCHTSNAYHHAPHIEICEKLAELSFGGRVFLSNSGTESVEAALKLSRRYFADRREPRQDFVATVNGFHGRTMGALSVTGQETYRAGFEPLIPGVTFVPYNDLESIERAVGAKTAAVIVEPIQGNGGVQVAKPGYLAGLRRICDNAGCLLILDEVQSGMGRTTRWFAYEHDNVVPDILCLAKALGGGLPLGAMVTNDELAKTLQPGVHGTTFGGNPVACAAGLATIETIQRDGLLERGHNAAQRLFALLTELREAHAAIVEIRHRGLLFGLQCHKPVKELAVACRKNGLLTTTAGAQVLRLFPPLNVTDADLERATEILHQAVKEVWP